MNVGLQAMAWHDLFAASASASAALLGLLFVAMSLHVREIQKSPILRLRARVNLQALAALVAVALLVLLPGQPNWLLGVELIVVLAVYLPLVFWSTSTLSRELGGLPESVGTRLLVQHLLLLLQVAAALSLIAGQGPGLFLEAPVFLLGLPVTTFNTWNVLFAPEAGRD
ncbi:MAG TPA: hypothetical protein VFR33_13760 [Candidatus Dormibacteraeota bacterium]|nr:hypothetical protein [Candidatus Dormibacteraeota bacterium]